MEKWRRYRHPKIYQTDRRSTAQPRLTLNLPRLPGWATAVAAVGVSLAAGAWFFLASPVFQISSVSVAGDTTPAITDWSASLLGKNLFTLREEAVLADLAAQDPTVKDVVLARGVPDALKLTVTRRRPALVWQTTVGRWSVDTQGVVFPYDESLAVGMPVVVDHQMETVELGSSIISPEFIAFVQAATAEVPRHIDQPILQAEVHETTLHLGLQTEEGWRIWLDTTRPLTGQLASLDIIIRDYREKIHEYVDLRLPGWGYVK